MSSKGETVLLSTLKEAISTVNTGGDWMSGADGMPGFGSRRSVGFFKFFPNAGSERDPSYGCAVSGGIEEYRGGRLSCVERCCRATIRSPSLSRSCCATGSCSAAPMSAKNSCARAGSKQERIS